MVPRLGRRDSDEPTGSDPLWVRVLFKYGVTGAIALLLVYKLAYAQADDIKAMRSEHQELRFYLRAICLVVAGEDSGKRSICEPTQGLK